MRSKQLLGLGETTQLTATERHVVEVPQPGRLVAPLGKSVSRLEQAKFAADSPLEEAGFEPSVPRQEKWSIPSSSDQTRVGRTLTLGGGAAGEVLSLLEKGLGCTFA